MKTTRKDWLLRSSVLAGLAASGMAFAPAQAQQPEQTTQPEAAPAAPTETIRVTGTRIQSPGVVANSPITTVGEEEFSFRQPVAVEELIRTLPAAAPAIGPGVNNGSGGGATIDLRGLGSNRTLVLMDDRRIVPFNLGGAVDTNVIPLALISRVDLVTGGAASVYGSDAISGVVNFVLKDDFEGVELAGSWGTSGDGDGDRRRAELTIGGNFDGGRGNAVFSVGYTLTDAIRQDARDIGLVSLGSNNGLPQGSVTAVPSVFNAPAQRVEDAAGNPILDADGEEQFRTFGGNQQIDPSTGELVAVYNPFNFNPDNYYQGPLDRYQMIARGNYEINRHAEVYADALYVNSKVGTQLASSGSFNNTYDVPIGNPYMPQPMREDLCVLYDIADCTVGNPETVQLSVNRRFEELGPRLNDFETTTFQYTAGIRGDIVGNWSYDAYYQYGQSDQIQIRGNWGSNARVGQALNAVSTTECVDTSNGCVPLNVFGEEGTITQDQVDFINLSAILRQSVEQEVLFGNVAGDLGEFGSPWASDPIALAGGYEYRRVAASTASDQASQIQGEVLGTGAPTPDREGTFQLYEFFGEAYVPLIQDMQFVRNLSLELGARNTEFKSGGRSDNYWTYKVGGEWAVVDDLRFRGLYQRATRAPNINELFAPQVTGLSNLSTDPCAGAGPVGDAALTQLCIQTGVPQGAIGNLAQPSAGQVNVLTGGNPELGPEVADTYTAGFVYQPSFVPGFSLSLDYFLIELEDAITAPSVADVIDQCYSTAFNPNREFNAACELVGRSSISGNLNDLQADGIILASDNFGTNKREGFDLNMSYGFDLADVGVNPDLGGIVLSFQGTLYTAFNNQPTPDAVNRDCLGYYSVACLNPRPDLKTTTRATWNVSDFDVSLQWRHIGSVIVEPGSGTWFEDFSRIPAYNYFDLSAGWDVNDVTRLNLTVANLTDESPPNVGNTIGATAFNSGNTFPQTYDVIGRFFTVGARVRF